ncbi:MAG: hypothetical protein ABIG96_05725 [Candidatus Micrarchaeota archaeon]
MGDWKDFLKPTWVSGIVFALFAAINYIFITQTRVLDGVALVGFPLGFYPIGSMYCELYAACPLPPEFSGANFLLNLIIWYLIGCIVSFGFEKLRGSLK